MHVHVQKIMNYISTVNEKAKVAAITDKNIILVKKKQKKTVFKVFTLLTVFIALKLQAILYSLVLVSADQGGLETFIMPFTLMYFRIGTPKPINIPFVTNGK